MEPLSKWQDYLDFSELDSLIDTDYFSRERKLWTTEPKLKYDHPPSCAEEENLRILAEADLGDEPDLPVSVDIERGLRAASNFVIQSPSLPNEVFVSAATMRALKEEFETGELDDVHTGYPILVEVK